jgi:PAS domain S-box-containing protein
MYVSSHERFRVFSCEGPPAQCRRSISLPPPHMATTPRAGSIEQALRKSAERFRLVVEAATGAMVMIRADGHIEMVNAQAERLFGYPRAELLGQPVEILIPERFRCHHPALRGGFFRTPQSRPMGAGRELFGRRKDGSEFPIEIGLNPIETEDGPMVLSAIVDTSERASAARALARSESEFRASFEAAAVGKVLADPASRVILRANRAFARMLGYEPEELAGRFDTEFTWHEDLASDAANYARLLSGEDDAHIHEKRYTRRDGTPFWARVSATLARAAGSDHPTLAIAAIEDIDARHTVETALRAAKLDLERVVDERTAALRQRDVLLREVYHRVKNNLQIVDSLLMMQARKTDDARAKDGLLGLRGRIFALGLVHQQLMESSDLKSFDVVPFLHELSNNILEGGGTGGVTLSVEACALDVGLDFAVPLGLLVTELVTNSLKHAFPAGTGNISVLLRPEGGGNLVLIVSDDGCGQSGKGQSNTAGSGLGASIIKSLVSQLEGAMIVRNENGLTTEIRIAMPKPS